MNDNTYPPWKIIITCPDQKQKTPLHMLNDETPYER